MPKKSFVLFIILNIAALTFLVMLLKSDFAGALGDARLELHDQLMTEQRRVEAEYLNFIENHKKEVVSTFMSKDVQKLRRASLRKKYFRARKADRIQTTLRFAAYTIKKKGSDLTVRPVYETFQSKIFWDKLLKMLAKQAFISTNEMSATLNSSGGEKFTEIIGILLKDAGLSALERPGNFNEFTMLGEDSFLYWDIIYKKCNASVRRATGSKKCVKGIFVAEIDRRNSVRDFALNWQKNTNANVEVVTEFGQLERSLNQSFIEAYWPLREHSNSILGVNLNKFINDSGSRFFKQGDELSLIRKSQVLPNALLVSKIRVHETYHFAYLMTSIILLSVTILMSFCFIPRS